MNFPKITDLGINSTRNPGRSYNLIVKDFCRKQTLSIKLQYQYLVQGIEQEPVTCF